MGMKTRESSSRQKVWKRRIEDTWGDSCQKHKNTKTQVEIAHTVLSWFWEKLQKNVPPWRCQILKLKYIGPTPNSISAGPLPHIPLRTKEAAGRGPRGPNPQLLRGWPMRFEQIDNHSTWMPYSSENLAPPSWLRKLQRSPIYSLGYLLFSRWSNFNLLRHQTMSCSWQCEV